MAQSKTAAKTEETFVLKLMRRFKAPREAVFRAWTDPEAFAQWMGPEGVTAREVSLDPRPGGTYSAALLGPDGSDHPLSGTYKEVVAPSRLVFTFVWGFGDLKDKEMLISLDFTEEDGSTLMTMVQEYIPTETARGHHTKGWEGSFKRLERYLSA
jgi:uncharacterized protein YndB with AHSA1/START domain